MWSANITNKQVIGGDLQVTVNYTDGVSNITETYRTSDAQTNLQTIKNRVTQLQSVTDSVASVVLGPVDLTPPIPTQHDLNVQDYNIKYAKLLLAKQQLDLGLITQGAYNQIQNDAKAAFALI